MVFTASKNTAKPSIQQISSEIPDDRAVDSSLVSHLQSLSENLGRINLDNEEPNYVESTHWTAILDGISELKDSLNEKVEPENVPKTIANIQETSRPTLLCPEEYTISKHDILAAIPPKAVVDSLVATCFTHAEILYVLLHAPTFQKQYESFWKQPQSTPIMWMAILYGLMCMGTHYEFFSVLASEKIAAGILPIESQNQVEMFRRKMIQCIVLGGYTKGVPHTIETLLLYLHVEFLGKPDSPTEFWLLLGILVRLAYRLGYHRDGSQIPSITPFEAEMRRRRWCSIVQMETMASTQFGLPKMIKESQSDVAPPHNLFDEDFDESTTKLPESRPITTVTPSLYLITKTNLFSIFGRISELTLQTTQAPYAEVMTLDKALDDFQKNMPPSFKMRSMTQSITDRPELIFQRIWIALLHLKCKCVLHRRYLRVGRLDKRCTYSRITCIDSALQMLSLQNMLYGESLPNGRLFQEYWRYSSMLKQEYLLAVAILCVDVYTDLELEDSPANPKYPVDKQSRYRILDAIRIALSIWEQEGGESLEAKKAQSALQLVLDKAKNTDASRRSRQDGSSSSPHISHEADSFSFGKICDALLLHLMLIQVFRNRLLIFTSFEFSNARGGGRA